jgi:hypothetical protein
VRRGRLRGLRAGIALLENKTPPAKVAGSVLFDDTWIYEPLGAKVIVSVGKIELSPLRRNNGGGKTAE